MAALEIQTAAQLGQLVKLLRERDGLTQEALAQKVTPTASRTVVAHLEQGHAIPPAPVLNAICLAIKLPEHVWRRFTDGAFVARLKFEEALSELVGRPVSLEALDPDSERTATQKIQELFEQTLPAEHAHDALNSILIYYGVRPVTRAFFDEFITPEALRSQRAFDEAIRAYQQKAIRLFATFGEAFRVLASTEELARVLLPLAPRDEHYLDNAYRKRTDWSRFRPIPDDRLPDLGYISAARVKQETQERQTLSTFLKDLAREFRKRGDKSALTAISDKRRRQMDSLLTKFNASFKFALSGPLFGPDADAVEREAERIGPKEEGTIAQMAETQRIASENLANYLSADHLDCYVATSMRSDADFVSVNPDLLTWRRK